MGFVEIRLRDTVDDCEWNPVGYIEGWFVSPGFRRRGIGRALIEAAAEWCRNRGCRELTSDAEPDNTSSQQVHRRLGFEEISRLIHYRRRI